MTSELSRKTLELTREWCCIPSVKGNETDVARQAAEVASWLRRELGAEIVHDGPVCGSAPLVHARIDVGAALTVILYNMYDVMPATPDGWSVDPFEGGIANLDGIGEAFVARGAENNKGPLAGMLCVLREMLADDTLKVNVEILVEGEEENGSTGLRVYLTDPDCPVRSSIAGLFPSLCEYGGSAPRVYLGFSGIAKGVVRVDGGAWGGPSSGIHSSNAPWIANPARRLAEALSLCGSEPTGRLDQIVLDPEALAIIDRLAPEFDPAAELTFRKTQRYAFAGDAAGLLRHVLQTASFNISGLYTDPSGGNAIIPASARATFDLRCPPGLDPADYCAKLRQGLSAAGLEGVDLTVADSYPGCRFGADSLGVLALLDAYDKTSRSPQVWPWAIGSAPGYAFARHAESFLIGGAGRGGNAHGVDEFMTLEGLERFLASVRCWLQAVAAGTEA